MSNQNYWTKKQSQELFEKALQLESEGKIDEAAEAYRKSLDICPKNAQVLYNLGIAYATLGKIDQAIRCWRKAIWLEPNFRNELVRAFGVDDDRSETVIGDEFEGLVLEQAA